MDGPTVRFAARKDTPKVTDKATFLTAWHNFLNSSTIPAPDAGPYLEAGGTLNDESVTYYSQALDWQLLAEWTSNGILSIQAVGWLASEWETERQQRLSELGHLLPVDTVPLKQAKGTRKWLGGVDA